MAVQGRDPTIPCKTITWNVCTFITDLIAVQESLQMEGETVFPFPTKLALAKSKVP